MEIETANGTARVVHTDYGPDGRPIGANKNPLIYLKRTKPEILIIGIGIGALIYALIRR